MRHDRSRQRSMKRTLWAVAQMVYHALSPWRRKWRRRWGARPDEPDPALPGEALIPDAAWEFTHAVSIAADPDEVWPWIVQMGQGRGGFYSFERLENLLGCQITNTNVVLPDYQILSPGDDIRLHPTAPPLQVDEVVPARSLVLRSAPGDDAPGEDAAHPTDTVWAFHIVPDGAGSSRLIERGKGQFGVSMAERLFFSPLLFEPLGFVMSREMLLAIKERAETTSTLKLP